VTAVVAIETVLLVLLIALVAGLLRSHAEILRRLGPPGEAGAAVPAPAQAATRGRGEPAPAVSGTTPAGDAVKLDFDGDRARPTLLAFLSSGCTTCTGFWESLGEQRLPAGAQPLILTRGADRESPSRLRSLASGGAPVVMSSQAWDDYRVPGSPYFVLVDGDIRGEGAATSWKALTGLMSDAIEDAGGAGTGDSGLHRSNVVDERLAAAGINSGDPSLYPTRRD
jgi:hypothetical protein